MPESAQTSGPSGPSLEQILWRAVDRWEERPSLIDVEEFADHIAGVFDGDLPAERFVERFFTGNPELAALEPDLAEAVVRSRSERLHVYSFDLKRLEYVVLEDLDQVVVGLAIDVHGHPICCELWPGNTADVKTLVPVIERLRRRFGLRQVTVVADRGMVSQATLEAFEGSQPPVGYIAGVRMRRQQEVGFNERSP